MPRFQKDLESNSAAVLLVAITRRGRTEFYRFGEQSQYQRLYAIGSISKTLTAALVAKLVHEGRLSYTDSVYGSTVENLLTHTAGIQDFDTSLESLFSLLNFAWDGSFLYNDLDDKKLSRMELSLKPGRHPYQYSSIGYAVLQRYLEDKFHQPIQTLMKEVLTSLALEGVRSNPPPEEIAKGYPGENPFFMQRQTIIDETKAYNKNKLMLASAGYWATLSDLLLLIEAIRIGDGFMADLKNPITQENDRMLASSGVTLEMVEGHELYCDILPRLNAKAL